MSGGVFALKNPAETTAGGIGLGFGRRRAGNGDDFFVFTGWEPEVVSVVGDAIYVATFERHGTGLDNVAEKPKPVKVMEDGKMYIIMPNGTRYDATGKKVE